VFSAGGPWDQYQSTRAYHVWLAHVKKYQQLSRLVSEPALPGANNAVFPRHSVMKPHHLPRQARDKHNRKSATKSRRFLAAFMNGGCLQTTTTLQPHSVVLLKYPTI
jgi:hypothetical protein